MAAVKKIVEGVNQYNRDSLGNHIKKGKNRGDQDGLNVLTADIDALK